MKAAQRVDVWVWVLLYGGLLAAVLGIFVAREEGGAAIGLVLWLGGGLAAAAGVALIVLRSRMDNHPR
jgi:hypothetical protein